MVVKNHAPWMLIEVKKSAQATLSDNLLFFQEQLNAAHVFQLAYDLDYIDVDLFKFDRPKVVPMKSFLAQLI